MGRPLAGTDLMAIAGSNSLVRASRIPPFAFLFHSTVPMVMRRRAMRRFQPSFGQYRVASQPPSTAMIWPLM